MDYLIEVEKIQRTSDMLCTFHSIKQDKYRFWDGTLNGLNILLSAFIITFFTWPTATAGFLAVFGLNLTADQVASVGVIFAFTALTSSIALLAWRPAEKAHRHKQALNFYTACKHQARSMISAQAVDKIKYEELLENYLSNNEMPNVSDKEFVKLKQKHLLKIEISKALDQRPFLPIWFIVLSGFLRTILDRKTT